MALTQVSTSGIKDATVATADIANDAVTNAKIADNAIENNQLANGEITAAKLASNSVTAAKIANDAVGAEHIETLDADLYFADDVKGIFGASSDLQIFHNAGGNSQLNYANGNLAIKQGSHSDAQALQFDGNGHLYVPDNEKIYFGASADLQLYHDGSNSYLLNSAGNLILKDLTDAVYIQAPQIIFQDETTGEDIAKFISDGAVELYHNNTKRVETTAYGTKFPNGRIELPDESGHQFQIGAIGDFTMEHDGSNTYLKNITGNTVLQNDAAVEITASSGGTKRFRFDSDGLKFGSDTAAANALDDYEEGTFTPGIDKNALSVSNVTYHWNSGTYTKVGRLVTFWFDLSVSANGNTGSGVPYVTGLPFNATTGGTSNGGYGAPQFRNMTLTHGDMREYSNSSFIENAVIMLYHHNSSGSETASGLNGTGRITGQGFYYTTA